MTAHDPSHIAHTLDNQIHGRESTYKTGCRCDLCRAAVNAASRAARARKRAAEVTNAS